MDLYSNSRQELLSQGDKNFCVPLAFSIVSERPIQEVNQLMIDRKWRRKGCGSYQKDWMNMFDLLDLECHEITDQVRASGGKTVKSAIRVLDPKASYVVKVSRHLLAIKGGKVQDWTEGRQHRVKQVWMVKPKDQAPAQPAPVKEAPVKKARNVELLEEMKKMNFYSFSLSLSGKWVKQVTNDGLIYFSPSRNGMVQVFINNADTLAHHNESISKIAGKGPEHRKSYSFWMLTMDQINTLSIELSHY